MIQTEDVELTNGTLVLDGEKLRSAHIQGKARIVVREHSIEILPLASKEPSPVDMAWGIVSVPDDIARIIAESKDLENEL